MPPEVIFKVQDFLILEVGHPEVRIKLREEVWLITESLDTYSVLDTSRDVRIVVSETMVEDSEDSEANLGEILVISDYFRTQLIGLHNCVVNAQARLNYRHLPVKTGFTCSVHLYRTGF